MIPLSQFPRGNKIILTIKDSKDLMKEVCIGTDKLMSKTLSFIVNPFSRCVLYSVRVTNNGGIVFDQSEKGNIRIQISPDISLTSSDTPAQNYIKVCQRHKEKRQWKVLERFYNLDIIN